MDRNLTYAKTPAGEEATRQRTRVVQRNLRMVLLQVDGQMSVDELIAKIGNEALVVNALKELEKGGYVCLAIDAPSVWEQSKARVKAAVRVMDKSDSPISAASELSAASDFSGFSGAASIAPPSILPRTTSGTVQPLPVTPPPSPPQGPTTNFLASLIQGLQARLKRSRDESDQGADLKPFNKQRLSNIITSVVALVLLVLGAIVFLFPYDSYRDNLQSSLSTAFGEAVRIGHVDARFIPSPSLVLEGVSIGKEGTARIGEISIPQLLSLRSKSTKLISEVLIKDAVVSGDFLAQLQALGNGLVSGGAGFQLQHITMTNLTVQVGDFSLGKLNGEVLFKSGTVEKMFLTNEDHSLRLELKPGEGVTLVSVDANGWRVGGEAAPLTFSSVLGKGSLQLGKLSFRDLEINFFAGTMLGNVNLDWNNGFTISGDAQLSHLSARAVSNAVDAGLGVDGELSGALRYRSVAQSWGGLWANLEALVNMNLTNASISGIDLGEASRRGSGKVARGGSTKFQRLSGTLKISPEGVIGSDLNMDAGLLTAVGQFVALRDKTVNANLTVSINSSVSPIRMPVKIYGQLPTLETAVGK